MTVPGSTMTIDTVDYHTAGEPFRIVTGGVEPLPGRTIMDKRRYALEHLDQVRELLVFEPRGHADMYGCFVTEPEDAGAQLGVVFFHNAGYSTACGHGTIALVTWAIESSKIHAVEPETAVIVDVPSGRLKTVAAVKRARSSRCGFRNIPSFVLGGWSRTADRRAEQVDVAVAYGGAFYAIVTRKPSRSRSSPPSCRDSSSSVARSRRRWRRSARSSTRSVRNYVTSTA